MIDWKDFEKVDMRDGTMVKSDEFPETRKPAYILTIDPDPEIGIKKSIAEIKDLHNKKD